MTTANSTTSLNIQDACDLLTRTEHEISFIQSITLLKTRDEDLTLDSSQVSGLYYVLENTRKNITKVIEQISNKS